MGNINVGRVILGGLLAGLVINIGESVLNLFVVAQGMDQALKARNLSVEPEMVKLDGVFKECGLFEVPLNLGYDIETKVQIAVVRQMEKK